MVKRGRPRFDPWVRKIPWRRKWQPTLILWPGKFHGWRSLVGYSPWGCKELDTTEQLHWFTGYERKCGGILQRLGELSAWSASVTLNEGEREGRWGRWVLDLCVKKVWESSSLGRPSSTQSLSGNISGGHGLRLGWISESGRVCGPFWQQPS